MILQRAAVHELACCQSPICEFWQEIRVPVDERGQKQLGRQKAIWQLVQLQLLFILGPWTALEKTDNIYHTRILMATYGLAYSFEVRQSLGCSSRHLEKAITHSSPDNCAATFPVNASTLLQFPFGREKAPYRCVHVWVYATSKASYANDRLPEVENTTDGSSYSIEHCL